MRKPLVACAALIAVSLVAVPLPGGAVAAEATDPLDLSAFAPFDAGAESAYEPDQFVPGYDRAAVMPSPTPDGIVRHLPGRPARQFYLTSIIGGSFPVATADSSPSSILTAGGALGVAFDRSNGRLRVEVEGRYRGPIEQTYIGFNREQSSKPGIAPPGPIPVPTPNKIDLIGLQRATASGGWSAMANIWRDFELTDHIDVYGGGGIGAAGFDTTFQELDSQTPSPVVYKHITQYAWQVGLGGIWNVNDRVAVDVSYRIFGLGWSVTAKDAEYGFLRNEVLLSVRIYEPFRGLTMR
jgi:opacity protein-like surface antigen